MKRCLLIWMAALLLLSNGCAFKVKNKSFSINVDAVTSITFQKKYENEEGTAYYQEKVVTDQKNIRSICKKIQNMPLTRADSSVPQPIKEVSYVVIIKSETKHHLILNEEKAFYDQVAYEYVSDKTYREFAKLYESLNSEEKEAPADLY